MGNICVIGPRGTGKTTYLAALAHCYSKDPKVTITPQTEDAEKLARRAEDCIRQGINPEPTQIDGVKISSVDDLPYYSFRIEIKQWPLKADEFNVVVWDFPGEIFNDLARGKQNQLHQEFIEKCLTKDMIGCLMLLEGWDKKSDKFYEKLMSKFISLMDYHGRIGNLLLAVAMSKCERGELWPGRLDPKLDIFDVYLPKTTKTLELSRIPKKDVRFEAISTFGVLDRTDPRPNRQDEAGGSVPSSEGEGPRSFLREEDRWKPHNLISPLYWLSKGKRLRSNA